MTSQDYVDMVLCEKCRMKLKLRATGRVLVGKKRN